MPHEKLQQKLQALEARELIRRNVSFDFDEFLDKVGPAPSFSEALGPTAECLSVDEIHAFHVGQIQASRRVAIEAHTGRCETCSELLTSYTVLQPDRMPDTLFLGVTSRLEPAFALTRPSRRFTWPAVPRFVQWVAAPVLALLLFWILYPSRVYFNHANRPASDDWASGPDKISIPSDPQKMRPLLDNLVSDVNRGQTSAPRQVEWMLKTVTAKSATVPAGDPQAEEWAAYRTQLAALSAASHFEALRKKSAGNVLPLKITELRDVDGVPAIAIENDQVNSETIRALLQKSVWQSGISRLYVYQRGKRVYDITASAAKSAAPADALHNP